MEKTNQKMEKTNQKMFCSEVELGKFVGSINVIQDAYGAIKETSLTYRLHKTDSGINILSFNCLSDYTTPFCNGDFGLVSSEDHEVFHFIRTKVNPKFSINKVAVDLFKKHFDELSDRQDQLIHEQIKDKLKDSPLVFTGQGMGGYLAILFALLHQHKVDIVEETKREKTDNPPKRPICITFGSPLLGNEQLQGAISERPQWKSSFLNVVANTDPLARFFSSNSPYTPFGTFLFCTKSGGHTAFEDRDAILAILDAIMSSNAGNSAMYDYKNELESIRKKALYRGASKFNESNSSLLRAGVVSQFREIGVLNDISNDLVVEVEKKQVKMIKRNRNKYEPTKKLNDMKIHLTYMEWYMKTHKSEGGYYDVYKNLNEIQKIVKTEGIYKSRLILEQYWERTVKESDVMPQKEGAKLRKRWLFNATNYRRILEPLAIADHYKSGKTNYIADHRPEHYKLLEKWSQDKKNEERKKAASLTEDSCFWARVEEAMILLTKLKNGDVSCTVTMLQFEAYLLDAIKSYSVSPDVFLEGSSLMKWWREYDAYKGRFYDSDLAQYMKNGSYEAYK